MMNDWQGWLYVAAVLVPLGAFAVQFLFGRLLRRANALIATAAIATSFVLSVVGFLSYLGAAEGFLSGGHHGEAHGAETEQHVGRPAKATTGRIVLASLTHFNHTSRTSRSVAELASTAPAPAGEPGLPENVFAPGGSTGPQGSHHGPLAWTGSFNWAALGAGLDSTHGGGRALVIPFGIYIDNLAVIMFMMVTFIATLIHLYSMGYMREDARYPRFFMFLSLFCFSMLGLVASANVFMVFLFWELVGVCSYLLIGFWYEDKKNSDAANKAFITNRIGDVGMLIGLGLIWSYLGTFNIHEINRALTQRAPDDKSYVHRDADGRMTREKSGDVVNLRIHEDGHPDAPLQSRTIPYAVLTIAGLGIFAGCVGKSAQFPLHVWLPDAMAGPTPVSALIHAATMVAAGVYLVGRFFPLFTHEVLLTIAYAGGITLFIAASIAMVQTDYKKVLAYSTVSQLGFMMLGLGVGGWAAGLFHLLTHAFFKALLFLGAGSVYHAVHTYEMPVLGGLYRKMRWTALTMLAATLAISGVPLFSGFYSKDAILAASLYFVRHHPGHIILFLAPVVGAAMTAFYMFRLWFLVFAGEPRGFPATTEPGHGHGHGHDGHHDANPAAHAHESEPLILWPLIALAIPTIAIGYPWTILPLPGLHSVPVLEQMLEYGEPLARVDLGSAHLLAMGASILIATAGIGLGVLYYGPWAGLRRLDARRTAERFGPLHRFLIHKWYFDEVYDALLVRPTLRLARTVRDFDRRVIDGVVNGSARLTVLLSWLEGAFDLNVVDGLVNAIARAVYGTGDWGRGIQTGRLRNYLMVLSAGVVVLFFGVFLWIRRS